MKVLAKFTNAGTVKVNGRPFIVYGMELRRDGTFTAELRSEASDAAEVIELEFERAIDVDGLNKLVQIATNG